VERAEKTLLEFMTVLGMAQAVGRDEEAARARSRRLHDGANVTDMLEWRARRAMSRGH
jgi:hypothetical protein